MSYEVIDVEREGGTIWVTLNRPQALNALKPPQTFAEFSSVFDEIRRDSSVKALVITGSGDRAFCIGTDLDLLTEAYSTRNFAFFRDYLYSINNFMFALEELPVPTVAMVQGKARAGGFELILACDFVLMADEAKVGDVHTPFGHMPGAGATQRMARKVGIQRALEVILTGRWISAAEAVEMGLALQSAPRADLRRVTAQFVSAFEDKVRDSLAHTKRAVLRGWDLPLRDGVTHEIQSYLEYLATSEEPIERFWHNQAKRQDRKVQGAA